MGTQKTDIEIARETKLEPIVNVAKKLDVPEDALEQYGKYKAKLSEEFLESIENNKPFINN